MSPLKAGFLPDIFVMRKKQSSGKRGTSSREVNYMPVFVFSRTP